MALDPSIALAYRPPQVNVDVPSPIQQFGQVLSLRNMMQQGQVGQLELQTKMLQLEQMRVAAQERQAFARELQNPQTQTPSPAAPAPANIASMVASPTPVQTAPFGLTGGPESVPGLPNVGAMPAAPPQAAATTPAPTAAPVALGAATVHDPFANLPSPARIMQVAPTTGFSYVEPIAKAQKAYWENLDAQHKAQVARWEDLGTLAAGVHDEPTKLAAVAKAFQDGIITPEVRDQLVSHPYVKDEWDQFQIQALQGKERGNEIRAQINQKATEAKAAADAALRPYQLREAQAKATEAESKAQTATYGSVAQDAGLPTNQDEWDTFRAGVPDPLRSKLPATYSKAAQQQTVSILGQTPNERITSAETAKQHGMQNVFEKVKTDIEVQKNAREENIYQQTYGEGANQALVGVDPKLRTQATREAQKIGDEYAKAQAAADQFQSVLEMAKKGNKAAFSNLPIVGVEAMNAINGIKRIPRYQVEQFGNAASLLDKIQQRIGGLAQGQTIPADLLSDIETMQNTLRQNSESVFRSRRQNLNDVYKSNFPTDPSSGRGSAPGTVKMKAPDGTVRDIPSDQVDHYKSLGATLVQ